MSLCVDLFHKVHSGSKIFEETDIIDIAGGAEALFQLHTAVHQHGAGGNAIFLFTLHFDEGRGCVVKEGILFDVNGGNMVNEAAEFLQIEFQLTVGEMVFCIRI